MVFDIFRTSVSFYCFMPIVSTHNKIMLILVWYRFYGWLPTRYLQLYNKVRMDRLLSVPGINSVSSSSSFWQPLSCCLVGMYCLYSVITEVFPNFPACKLNRLLRNSCGICCVHLLWNNIHYLPASMASKGNARILWNFCQILILFLWVFLWVRFFVPD